MWGAEGVSAVLCNFVTNFNQFHDVKQMFTFMMKIITHTIWFSIKKVAHYFWLTSFGSLYLDTGTIKSVLNPLFIAKLWRPEPRPHPRQSWDESHPSGNARWLSLLPHYWEIWPQPACYQEIWSQSARYWEIWLQSFLLLGSGSSSGPGLIKPLWYITKFLKGMLLSLLSVDFNMLSDTIPKFILS